jgi:hypothetical protein
MPYKIGSNKKSILHYKNGRWSVKQTCSSPAAAKRAIRLLRGIEHGMKPRKRKK